jgi:hypothetical protein
MSLTKLSLAGNIFTIGREHLQIARKLSGKMTRTSPTSLFYVTSSKPINYISLGNYTPPPVGTV